MQTKTNIGGATLEGDTADDLAVEVLTAYLNPEDQTKQLRTALAELRAPTDDPDLTTVRTT